MLLEFTPNEKQEEAVERWSDSITIEITFGGAKYGGKSFLGSNCIFHDALVYPETFYFIARQKLNDIRKYTIPTINETFRKWNISMTKYCTFNGQDNYFHCYNESRVYLLECAYIPSDPLFERFGSMEMTRGWIEEGGEINVQAKANLLISIGRKNNHVHKLKPKLLITCNPKKNWLYSEFYKPFSRGTLPKDKAFIQALAKHNIHGDQDYIEQLSRIKDPIMRQRLYLGNWEYDDDPTALISYDRIIDVFSNDFVKPGRKYITADIARYGADKTVICVWSGWRAELFLELDKSSVANTAVKIRQLQREHNVAASDTIVDEDGIGGGVKDILECKGFVNNSTPIEVDGAKENFNNLRSQCYFKLADKINESEAYIIPQGDEQKEKITEELEAVKQKSVDGDGKKAIISREEFRTQLGRSPDYASTLMMRTYFDLKPRYKAVKSSIV